MSFWQKVRALITPRHRETVVLVVDPDLVQLEETCTVATGGTPGKYSREATVEPQLTAALQQAADGNSSQVHDALGTWVFEALGDTPEAPCYGLDKDKEPFRSTPHTWRSLMKTDSNTPFVIEGCRACGGTRRRRT